MSTVTHSQASKEAAAASILQRLVINYNTTGVKVHFILSADCYRSTSKSDAPITLDAGESAYFRREQRTERFKTRDVILPAASILWRDMSSETDEPKPLWHRTTLFVPMPLGRATMTLQPSRLVNDDAVEFTSVFVSEAHGVYLQNYREWIPPDVIVLFPLSSSLGCRSGETVMDVAAVGVLYSSNTSTAHDLSNLANIGAPVWFGSEWELNNWFDPQTKNMQLGSHTIGEWRSPWQIAAALAARDAGSKKRKTVEKDTLTD